MKKVKLFCDFCGASKNVETIAAHFTVEDVVVDMKPTKNGSIRAIKEKQLLRFSRGYDEPQRIELCQEHRDKIFNYAEKLLKQSQKASR